MRNKNSFNFLFVLIVTISTAFAEEKVHNLANLQQLTFYQSSDVPRAVKFGPNDKTVLYERNDQIYSVSTIQAFPRPHRVSTGLGSNHLIGHNLDGNLLYSTNAFHFPSITDAFEAAINNKTKNSELPADLITANSLGNLIHRSNITVSENAFADPSAKYVITQKGLNLYLIDTRKNIENVILNLSDAKTRIISGAISRKLDRIVISAVNDLRDFKVFSFVFENGKLLNQTTLQKSNVLKFFVNDFTPCGKKVIVTVCPDEHGNCGMKVYSATDKTDHGVDIGGSGRPFSGVRHAAFSHDGKKLAFVKKSGDFFNVMLADWNCDDHETSNATPKKPYEKLIKKSKVLSTTKLYHSKYTGLIPRFKNGSKTVEKHLKNIKQLTFGGQNAEGYFAFKTDSFVFQAAGLENYGTACDQIYRQDFDRTAVNPITSSPQRLSTGLGSCTCSYFFPNDNHAIYASTFLSIDPTKINDPQLGTCDPKKCQSKQAKTDPTLKALCNTSYTWDLHPGYDIFHVDNEGNFIERLTDTPGYDAEGAISPDGKFMVFTSVRSGDPELWLYNFESKLSKQLTNELGYDGGPFFSPDGTKIGFRASRPKTDNDVKKYKTLLSYDLVEPLAMELYTINVDGTGMRQIAQLGKSNWAPFYLNDNRRIIFSSNMNAISFGGFNLYIINDDGTGLEQVTFSNGFDAFPMMSRDGRLVIWGSSRNGKSRTDLNLFVADWFD